MFRWVRSVPVCAAAWLCQPVARQAGVFAMLCGLLFAGPLAAHDFRAGAIVLDHPYATPSLTQRGAVYFRALRNRGDTFDRLLSASTPVAERVGLHTMQMDGDVMRMREVSGIDLPPRAEVRMGHSQTHGHHLMLQGLKMPLKDGDRFELTLRFEKAGEHTVQIWVQKPRSRAVHAH